MTASCPIVTARTLCHAVLPVAAAPIGGAVVTNVRTPR